MRHRAILWACFFAVSVWVCAVVPLRAAAALITSLGVADSDQTGSETSSAINTSGATLIAIFQGNYAGGSGTDAANAPTDNQGNTYTALTMRDGTAFGLNGRWYYKINPATNASHTFTISSSGNMYECAHISIFSGTGVFDQETGTNMSASPGSLTPAEDNELLVVGATWGDNDNGADLSAVSASFTAIGNSVPDTSPTFGCGAGYQVQTTATARNPSVTLSNTDNITTAMAAFKVAAAATGATGKPMLLGVGR